MDGWVFGGRRSGLLNIPCFLEGGEGVGDLKRVSKTSS